MASARVLSLTGALASPSAATDNLHTWCRGELGSDPHVTVKLGCNLQRGLKLAVKQAKKHVSSGIRSQVKGDVHSPYTEYHSEQRQWGGKRDHAPAATLPRQRPLQESAQLLQPVRCQSVEESRPSERASESENDIAARLPELREVLGMLKKRHAEESSGEGGARGPGSVYLVGTGPGDAELLTVKALRLLQSAHLVLYDRLVSTDILDLIHPGARLLYVGKTSGYHSRTQEEIHELLLAFAEAGATVVRLKGGDPMVFGRGGEEMDFLQEKGIQVQIVPGLTLGLLRAVGECSVRFLTGHSRKGGEDPLYVAESAADPDSTLVIYMGLATLPGLTGKLMANGLPGSTPAVAVERGTTPDQRIVFATLDVLHEEVEAAKLVSPTLIIVGRVVALSHLWPHQSSQGHSLSGRSAAAKGDAGAALLGGPEREPRDRAERGADPALPSQSF
eukprot:jgi/Mesen1/3838/ME000207S02849